MKKKIADMILIGFLLLFIFGFGLWTWLKDDNPVSALENRDLKMRPDATVERLLSGEYFKSFEAYFNDQFPGRQAFIEANASVDKFIMQKDEIRDVYALKNGYLINPVHPKDKTKEVNDKINSFAHILEKKNIDVYFALPPNKSTIMENKLPDYIEAHGNELSDKLMDGFSKDVHALDLRPTIKPHLQEPNMYFHTDHHWKPKAAHYAYEKIIDEMSKQHPGVGKPIPKSQFTWKEAPEKFYGSDARKTTKSYASKPDTITIAQPEFKEKPISICYRKTCGHSFYDMSKLKEEGTYANHYQTYFSGDVSEAVIKNPNKPNGPKVLILKDSYVNPMIQFLSRNFSETRIIDMRHYKQKSVYQYIDQHDIDAVLFVHNINSINITPAFVDFKHPGGGENQ
ncbi:DHHW family protein [Fictibacillus sp. NRS-1165]|uniref:DHHW family protein n=1 Tax=Fictibacillus sp. NRS-1165 TaxID=3144463 RepID=UPI003D19CF8F